MKEAAECVSLFELQLTPVDPRLYAVDDVGKIVFSVEVVLALIQSSCSVEYMLAYVEIELHCFRVWTHDV